MRTLARNLPSEATSKFCDNSNVRLKQLLDFFLLLTILLLHIYSFLFYFILCSLLIFTEKLFSFLIYISLSYEIFFSFWQILFYSILLFMNNLFFLTNKSLLYLSLRNQLFSFWKISNSTYSSSWKKLFSIWQTNSFLTSNLFSSWQTIFFFDEYFLLFPRAQRQSNICLTGIAYIGAKLAERSDKQVLWQ